MPCQESHESTDPSEPDTSSSFGVYRATVLDATLGRRWHSLLSFRPIEPATNRSPSGRLATWTDGAAEPSYRLAAGPGDWGIGRDGRLRDRDRPTRRLRAAEALALAVAGDGGFSLQGQGDPNPPTIADDYPF